MQLHHTGRFKVGDEIRGYDYPTRRDSYVQGVVIDANFMHPVAHIQCYRILTTKRVMFGLLRSDEPEGFIPHAITPFLERDDRIELVKAK